jgi:predicted nucleic acid-binding protein
VKPLDTSVAIDHLRGSLPAVNLLTDLLEAEESIFASEVVRFELLAGVREKEVDALEQFFSAISWVPVGEEVARAAGAPAQRHRTSISATQRESCGDWRPRMRTGRQPTHAIWSGKRSTVP